MKKKVLMLLLGFLIAFAITPNAQADTGEYTYIRSLQIDFLNEDGEVTGGHMWWDDEQPPTESLGTVDWAETWHKTFVYLDADDADNETHANDRTRVRYEMVIYDDAENEIDSINTVWVEPEDVDDVGDYYILEYPVDDIVTRYTEHETLYGGYYSDVQLEYEYDTTGDGDYTTIETWSTQIKAPKFFPPDPDPIDIEPGDELVSWSDGEEFGVVDGEGSEYYTCDGFSEVPTTWKFHEVDPQTGSLYFAISPDDTTKIKNIDKNCNFETVYELPIEYLDAAAFDLNHTIASILDGSMVHVVNMEEETHNVVEIDTDEYPSIDVFHHPAYNDPHIYQSDGFGSSSTYTERDFVYGFLRIYDIDGTMVHETEEYWDYEYGYWLDPAYPSIIGTDVSVDDERNVLWSLAHSDRSAGDLPGNYMQSRKFYGDFEDDFLDSYNRDAIYGDVFPVGVSEERYSVGNLAASEDGELHTGQLTSVSPSPGHIADIPYIISTDYSIAEEPPEPDEYTVSLVDIIGEGSVEADIVGDGVETLDSETDSFLVDDGTDVEFSPDPDEGWVWDEWTEDASGETEIFTKTITEDYDIGVAFEEEEIPVDPNIEVETLSATNVDNTSATIRGELTELEEIDEADLYLYWRKEDEPDWNEEFVETSTSPTTFTHDLENLDNQTTYEFYAYGEGEHEGVTYSDEGDVETFFTEEVDVDILPTFGDWIGMVPYLGFIVSPVVLYLGLFIFTAIVTTIVAYYIGPTISIFTAVSLVAIYGVFGWLPTWLALIIGLAIFGLASTLGGRGDER